MLEFQVATNRNYTDKVKPGDGRFWKFNMSFENETLTLPAFVDTITAGHAWTAPHAHVRHHRPTRKNPNYHTTYRVEANVSGSQLLALDSDTEDGRSSFASLLADPFISQYAALLHASASSTPARPRSRVVFLLDNVLDPNAYELALRALLFAYPFCDQSVKHAAVVFYGAKDCAIQLLGNTLPVAVLWERLVQPYQAHLEEERRLREETRQRRLAAVDTTTNPPTSQVTTYVAQMKKNILDDLAAAHAGRGLRHTLLFESALKLGSLGAAPWLHKEARSQVAHLEADLFEAAVRNGYVNDYGEDDTWRTIENGVDMGAQRPFIEPVWFAPEHAFAVGDQVTAVVGERIIAEGRIQRFREGQYWEYELDSMPNTWFAKNLLQRGD